MSLTKAPCPACKVVDKYRHVTDVCSGCQRLLREALAARDALEHLEGTELVVTGEPTAHWWEGYYESLPSCCSHNTRDEIRKAYVKLVYLLGTTTDEYVPFDDRRLYSLGKWESSSISMRFKPAALKALRNLDEAIRKSLMETYEYARREGHNILLELARGELSVDEFNQQTLPTSRRRRKR